MKEEDIKTTVEIFVCNHKDCAEKDSKELTDKLKKWAKEEHKKKIKVFRSGCLGQCSDGIAIACYPEKKFILNAKLKDSKELKERFEEMLQKASQ